MNPDFSEMLSALSAEGVEFLVVGAYAVAAHGFPRMTQHIDIWVRPSAANAPRVLRALARFGAPQMDLTQADLLRDDMVFQIGVAPNRIDILTGVAGVTFDEAWRERLTGRVEGVDVCVIGRAHLLRNKKATGRARDRIDVDRLERNE